jgi:16S rRNA (cytosine967-C5)-methyltransferase
MTANIAPARRAAFFILQKVLADKGNRDTLLHGAGMQSLSQLDRNLCTALVMGTLRWQRVLDARVREHLSQPTLQLPVPVELALRLGAFQLLLMDRVPVYAVIFESVEWVKQSAHPRAAGLVNAVLRKLAALPRPNRMLPQQAYPEWMLQRWRANYGAEATEKICAAGQQEPETTVRLLAPEVEEELRAEGVQFAPGEFLSQARKVVSGEISATRAVREGRIHIQDEGSQLVAELLGQGQRILDCCAAPGGKTAVLLERSPQASVVACDASPARLRAMQQRLARPEWHGRVEYHMTEAAQLPGMGLFDRILCDVPCTGTGTLARNPEIRHRLQPEDLVRQAKRQRSILAGALRRLAPGGRLLYATCSLEPEENEEIVRSSLEAGEHAQQKYALLDLQEVFEGLAQQGVVAGPAVVHLRATGFRAGCLHTLPGVHPCDGFFAALIGRRDG